MLPCIGAVAGDVDGYVLSIAPTGNDTLDAAILSSAQLAVLQGAPPDNVFALLDRARGDIGRIETALGSYGYYRPSVVIRLNGHVIGVADTLSALATDSGGKAQIDVAIDKGALYHIRHVGLTGTGSAELAGRLALKTGDVAEAATVLAAGKHLQHDLREEGYAFARVGEPDAVADDAAAVLDISYPLSAGNKAQTGPVRFHGLNRMDEGFVRQVFAVTPGMPYHVSTIDRGRADLLALGSFAEVSVANPSAPDAAGNAPVDVTVVERKRHRVAVSAGYSTDLGTSLAASWSHRNLLGEAEQLNLSAAATGWGGRASSGIGYSLTAQFLKPHFLRIGQQLELSTSAVQQDLDAYDQTAEVVGGYLQRPLSRYWSARGGVSVTFDDVSQAGTTRYYQLFAVPLSLSYDDTDIGSGAERLSDPVQGWRAGLSVTPTVSLGNKDVLFAQMQASVSAYYDVFQNGRSVLAARVLMGTVEGASSLDLPPDQRLYAGGSGTVRGYRYQSIGPEFSNGDPAGATSVDAASVEWRQRLWGDLGVVGFFDMGQAGNGSLPFHGQMHYGAGGGVRYYTPIGAVRFDVAVPLTHVASNDSFQIYISIGQAF